MPKILTSRWTAAFILCLTILIADQWTKLWAVEVLKGEEAWVFLGGIFRMQFAYNPGGFLGLGGNLSSEMRTALFIGLNGVGLLALAILPCVKRLSLLNFFACWLIFAGGIGNQIDRIRLENGHVIDFLNIGWGSLRSGIFNIADMAITAGALILLVAAIMAPAPRKSPATSEEPQAIIPDHTEPTPAN